MLYKFIEKNTGKVYQFVSENMIPMAPVFNLQAFFENKPILFKVVEQPIVEFILIEVDDPDNEGQKMQVPEVVINIPVMPLEARIVTPSINTPIDLSKIRNDSKSKLH